MDGRDALNQASSLKPHDGVNEVLHILHTFFPSVVDFLAHYDEPSEIFLGGRGKSFIIDRLLLEDDSHPCSEARIRMDMDAPDPGILTVLLHLNSLQPSAFSLKNTPPQGLFSFTKSPGSRFYNLP